MNNQLTQTHPSTITVHSDRDGGVTYTTDTGGEPSTPWAIILILLAVFFAMLSTIIQQFTELAQAIEQSPIGFSVVALLIAAALYALFGK